MGTMAPRYDALLLVSFGGPEGPDDVMPFLRNVVRGRNVPEDRLRQVASQYAHFGGVSPIGDQCRALMKAVGEELAETRLLHLPFDRRGNKVVSAYAAMDLLRRNLPS